MTDTPTKIVTEAQRDVNESAARAVLRGHALIARAAATDLRNAGIPAPTLAALAAVYGEAGEEPTA